MALFAVWTVAIEARLIYLQVVSHDELTARAERQQLRTVPSPAKRGEIYDRHGRLLAYSVDTDTIYAVPYDIKDAADTAKVLCAAFAAGGAECTAKEQIGLTDRLGRQRAFSYVRRRVTPREAKQVADLNLEGIGFMKESRRFYPNKELAAHLLGYVGLDNVGLNGLEAAYDKVIRGREGTLLIQTDARSRAFSRLERSPTVGGSLELTIDEQLQHIVERELRAGVLEKRADGGSAIVMDPSTGEILALANWPTFNPNSFDRAGDAARRNRAVQDIYEPGSTFKVVTVAAALEEKLMPVDALIDTSPGIIRFGRRVIDEYGGRDHGQLSLTDVIVKSSNVGAIKIGLKVGAERFGLYANRFGFGKPTSPDFPGESPGILWPAEKLNDSALASMSMGYQVGVTPLQMAAAMNTVANGGTWVEPRTVRSVVRDGVRTRVTPKVVRRAISEHTAAALVPILEAVVENGTGQGAKIAGFSVAGKTGTADKLINGRYSNTHQNVSFLGFVPSRHPALTVIVMIDTPRVGSDTGGAVAAPIFKRIAEAALRHLGVPPNVNPAPPVMVARREQASVTTVANNVLPSIVTLASSDSDASVVPDLRGLSGREASRALARIGLTAKMQGVGVVVSQMPAAGAPLERGATCLLTLERDVAKLTGAAGVAR